MVSKVIEGRTVKIEVGTPIRLGINTRQLLPCDDWDKAQFRWPALGLEIACNVAITGRTFQRWGDNHWVKVQMIWVGDGQPDQYTEAWALINPWKCPKANPTD